MSPPFGRRLHHERTSAHEQRDERIDMRPVVVQMGVTLDGFVHGAKGYEEWGLAPEDDEVVAWKVASLREAGTHIMGRVTYEAMSTVSSPLRLDLVEARTFPTGTATHVYRPG